MYIQGQFPDLGLKIESTDYEPASVNIVTNNELQNDLVQNYRIKPSSIGRSDS